MAKHTFLVRIPKSEEDTDFIVIADSPQEAAEIYITSALIEDNLTISVDDLLASGKITTHQLPDPKGKSRIASWHNITRTEIGLEDIAAWRDRPSASSDLGM